MSKCTIKYEVSDLGHKLDIDLDYDPDYKPDALWNYDTGSCTADAPMNRELSSSSASSPGDHTNYTYDNDDSIDIKDEPLRLKTELKTQDMPYTHVEEIWYECVICHKQFVLNASLRKHIRSHTGEKPLECNICQKRFTTNNILSNHMRAHTGETPYECNICHKQFVLNSRLKEHMRTHTGEKPFECDICHKRFSHKCNLVRHKGLHI